MDKMVQSDADRRSGKGKGESVSLPGSECVASGVSPQDYLNRPPADTLQHHQACPTYPSAMSGQAS